MELKDMMFHIATRVEGQLKRNNSSRPSQLLGSSSTWKPNWKANVGVAQSQSNIGEIIETTKKNKDIFTDNIGKVETPTSCNRDIKYFHCLGVGHVTSLCPNKRAMIIKAHGEVVTDRKVSDEEMGLKMKMMNVLSIRLRGRRLQWKEHWICKIMWLIWRSNRKNIFYHVQNKGFGDVYLPWNDDVVL